MTTKKLVFSALCLALCILLPFLTAQVPEIGSMLLPMHLPVLLCGFVCGGPWGLAVGIVAPVMRSLLFGMPPMFPTALAMAFELAAYGFFTGFFYNKSKKNILAIYISLVASMLAGRAVWGLVTWAFYSLQGSAFTLAMFSAGAFVKAVPGIILQLVIVPPIVLALSKSGIIKSK